MDEGSQQEDLAVHIRREHVLEDSFSELHQRSPEEWKNCFYIVFDGNIFILRHLLNLGKSVNSFFVKTYICNIY